jgi:hypothetical protein
MSRNLATLLPQCRPVCGLEFLLPACRELLLFSDHSCQLMSGKPGYYTNKKNEPLEENYGLLTISY